MKILIVTKNWLGDILFEIPAIEMIRKAFPEAEILCMTHPRCREILELHPAVDRVLCFDERGEHKSVRSKFKFIQTLRRENIQKAYLLHRSRTKTFMLLLAGIRERIGYEVKRPHFLTKAFPAPETPLHHVDYFIQLLQQSGLSSSENPRYTFYYSQQAEQAMERVLQHHGLQDFVCFHLGANWEPKRWPVAHFAQLADRIAEEWQIPILITGGEKDKKLGEEFLSLVQKARVISLIGQTSLGELAAIFKRSLFMVSSDSGPMHIASGVGTRVLAIFGPTHPELTGPRGTGETLILSYVPPGYEAPWYGKEFPAGGWLSQLKSEEVMSALKQKNWNIRPHIIPGGVRAGSMAPAFNSLTEPDLNKKMHRQRGNDKRKKILLITLSNIGDVIMTTPVLMSLASQFPEHSITVVAGPRSKGILEGSRFIDRLVIYDKHASLRQKLRFIQDLRRSSYEAAVDLKNTAIPFLVSARKRSRIFRKFTTVQARQKHLEILKQMGLENQEILPFDFFNAREEAEVKSKLREAGISGDKDWIVIAPIAASQVKSWPLPAYQEVIKRLLSATDHRVLLVGSEKEKEALQPLTQQSPSRIFNLAGQTTLRELAALIAGSRLLIANDSSAAQLGFEMNHPSVVIYGPTDPKKFSRQGEWFRILQEQVECSPCERAQCRLERQACFLDLSPAKVAEASLDLLSRRSARYFYSQGTSPA